MNGQIKPMQKARKVGRMNSGAQRRMGRRIMLLLTPAMFLRLRKMVPSLSMMIMTGPDGGHLEQGEILAGAKTWPHSQWQ